MLNWIYDNVTVTMVNIFMWLLFAAVVLAVAWFKRKDRDKWLPPQ